MISSNEISRGRGIFQSKQFFILGQSYLLKTTDKKYRTMCRHEVTWPLGDYVFEPLTDSAEYF